MQEQPKIAVLMSTYNGERYLKEQVDSILAQKGVEIELFVRDDGSSDRTVDILRGYRSKQIHIACDGENLGPGMSFMKLLYIVGREKAFDYYAFSDQDDLWLERKLARAVEKLKDTAGPVLYCSNQMLYKDEMNIGLRFSKEPDLSLERHIHKNDLSGCTMVLNQALVDRIISCKCPGNDILRYRLHDAWVFLVALLVGEVVYDDEAMICYRLHENNTVGVKKQSVIRRAGRLLGLSSEGKAYRNLRKKTARLLIRNYPDMDKRDREFLERFADYSTSIGRRIALASDRRCVEKSEERRPVFMLKVFLGLV